MSLNGTEPKEILENNLQDFVDKVCPFIVVKAKKPGFKFINSETGQTFIEVDSFACAKQVAAGIKIGALLSKK